VDSAITTSAPAIDMRKESISAVVDNRKEKADQPERNCSSASTIHGCSPECSQWGERPNALLSRQQALGTTHRNAITQGRRMSFQRSYCTELHRLFHILRAFRLRRGDRTTGANTTVSVLLLLFCRFEDLQSPLL